MATAAWDGDDFEMLAPIDTKPCQAGALQNWLNARRRATLELSAGTVLTGFSFGAPVSVSGEVVFNTGMVAYPESLTDPSYAGQILVFTYPLVGNYGIPSEDPDDLGLSKWFESDRIHVKAVVISDYSYEPSHYSCVRTLGDWLNSQGVPGIYGVDTRMITKIIRQEGAMLGRLLVNGSDGCHPAIPFEDPNTRNLVAEVSRSQKQTFAQAAQGQKEVHIIAVDCGMKNNIIRCLVALGVRLTVVPWDYDFSQDHFDGLFLSNGPGDPSQCAQTIRHVRTVMQQRPNTPIFGICLGNQILALAAGAKTFKMKFGNRGMNQPVVDLRTQRCYITAQNHGFAVDAQSLPSGWVPLMVNANDGTNEGIIHSSRPWFSVQFHPEACGGPMDTDFLFKQFLQFIAEPASTAVTTIPYSLPLSYRKVLVLGSGGLTIGQAGEFDYSGSQALKALKEAGIMSVLINPNIATVQTSAGMADRVYFLPVTPEFVTKVIDRERPDGIFVSFGGQTALNCACRLHEQGVFDRFNVQVLGTPIEAIIKTEDRDLFSQVVDACGERIAESSCCGSVAEAVHAAEQIGYPVLVRAAFALGGLGSGFADNENELRKLVTVALVNSPQVIVDKSLKGWKELEYEVVRDKNDNCITVCNMENLDPMGIHTGESIVIAPSQTLNNEEYYRLRQCALKIIRHLGIVGECNIQYAVDPKSSQFRIIEVNARLSRSSALASKATGYPLAYVAAKLALGHDLAQLRNSVTRCTTACFEPSLDYVVAKVPRWDLQKFSTVDARIGSAMQSVGEVMAIGRTFEETIQKALRMVDEASPGFDPARYEIELERRGISASGPELEKEVKKELSNPTPVRLWAVAKAFELGMDVTDVHRLTNIDRWFLAKLHGLHQLKVALRLMDFYELRSHPAVLREAKCRGFSDCQIAALVSAPALVHMEMSPRLLPTDFGASRYTGGPVTEAHIRHLRRSASIVPKVKQIDTLAAEFPAETNYLYLTYSGEEHDVELPGSQAPTDDDCLPPLSLQPSIPEPMSLQTPQSQKAEKESRVVVLGCGPYRIGSSVEFDWCSVSCVRTLRKLGHKAVVVNCNPETVSTDFDESDRLYFEELSHERVLDIAELETPRGMVVSVGGQTPNNLALGLHHCGVRILGTSVEAIDTCEDRKKFSQLCDQLRIDQPQWSQFETLGEARNFYRSAGFPVLVRPSYVLSGAAMRVVTNDSELEVFLKTAAVVSRDHPVVISKYITGAKEVELDAVGRAGELVNYAIAEHIENAGVHSGDASLLLPAQRLFVETHRKVKSISQKLCKALKISGPFNIQFICKDNEVKVIECNLRASRSMPFISKTYNVNFIELATRVMVGMPVRSAVIQPMDIDFVACKAPMFSFGRLKNSDPRLGVEMSSTGEVACFGMNAYEAFLKSMVAANFKLPSQSILLSLGSPAAKSEFVSSGAARQLLEMGYSLYATKGTHEHLVGAGLQSSMVFKPLVKREPNAATLLQGRKVDLVINVPDSMDSDALTDGFRIRRGAVDSGTSLITDIKTAIFMCHALHRKWTREASGKPFWDICSWQEPVLLVAESLGAVIALSLALKRPSLPQALCLLNPATSYRRSALSLVAPVLPRLPEQLYTSLPAVVTPLFGKLGWYDQVVQEDPRASPDEDGPLAELMRISRGLSRALPPDTLQFRESAYLREGVRRLEPLLLELRLQEPPWLQQTLLVAGDSDAVLPSMAETERLLKLMPGAQRKVIPGGAHACFDDVTSVNLLSLLTDAGIVQSLTEAAPEEMSLVPESWLDASLMQARTWVSPVFLSVLPGGQIVRGLPQLAPAALQENPILFVGNHQLFSLDGIFLVDEFLREQRRLVTAMVYPPLLNEVSPLAPLPYPFPGSRQLFEKFKVMPTSARNLLRALRPNRTGNVDGPGAGAALLFPGGAREVFKRKGEEYQLFWPPQPEFIRIAAKANATIIPFSGIGSDEFFAGTVLDSSELLNMPVVGDWLRDRTQDLPSFVE
ncbi:URA2, partial [Symbiodinium sp. CCMP2456]